jgi:hypothetical protein
LLKRFHLRREIIFQYGPSSEGISQTHTYAGIEDVSPVTALSFSV